MNSRLRTAAALLMTLLLISMSAISAWAESTDVDGSASFDGKDINADFSSKTIAKAVSDLQPGDDVTFTITYTNDYSKSTDWYMENSVVKTLEKTSSAKKHVAGTGAAENGGYTYELILHDANGDDRVLFSNEEVGGENKAQGMEGLEQATNALDEWFYIDTLLEGQSGEVTLHVAFDGETEVNDYMDTDGELNLRFAVELTPEDNPPDDNPPDKPHKRVKTGDESDLIMWASIGLIGGMLLMVLAFISRRRDRRAEEKGGKH